MNNMTLSHEQRSPIMSMGNIFLFIFAMYPYIFLINMLLPIDSIGFNFYFASTTIALAILFIVMLMRCQSKATQQLVVFAVLIFFVFMLMHLFVEKSYSPSLIMSNRIGVTPIFYLFIAFAAIKIVGKNIISKIVVTNAFIQAVIGIVHYNFFSNIITGSELVPEGQLYIVLEEFMYLREPGILESASLYANMILLGIFILGFNRKKDMTSIRIVINILMVMIMVYGISLSHSRYPAIVAFVFCGYIFLGYAKTYFKFNFITVIILSVSILVVSQSFSKYIYPEIDSMLTRLSYEGMGVRIMKNQMAMAVMLDSYTNLLIGADAGYIGAVQSDEGLGISDNSFLALGMNLGLIYFLFMLAIVCFLLVNTVKINFRGLFLLAYFTVNLFLTNSVYWDIYLLYFFATMYAINILDFNEKRSENNTVIAK